MAPSRRQPGWRRLGERESGALPPRPSRPHSLKWLLERLRELLEGLNKATGARLCRFSPRVGHPRRAAGPDPARLVEKAMLFPTSPLAGRRKAGGVPKKRSESGLPPLTHSLPFPLLSAIACLTKAARSHYKPHSPRRREGKGGKKSPSRAPSGPRRARAERDKDWGAEEKGLGVRGPPSADFAPASLCLPVSARLSSFRSARVTPAILRRTQQSLRRQPRREERSARGLAADGGRPEGPFPRGEKKRRRKRKVGLRSEAAEGKKRQRREGGKWGGLFRSPRDSQGLLPGRMLKGKSRYGCRIHSRAGNLAVGPPGPARDTRRRGGQAQGQPSPEPDSCPCGLQPPLHQPRSASRSRGKPMLRGSFLGGGMRAWVRGPRGKRARSRAARHVPTRTHTAD